MISMFLELAALSLLPFVCLASVIPNSKLAISPTTYKWEDLHNLPVARQEHSVVKLNDKIYIIGGITSNVSFTTATENAPADIHPVRSVQVYDTKTRTWSDASPMPISLNHGNAATVNGKIYMLGGLSGTNMSSWNALPNSYVYDPTSDTWSELPSMPSNTARGGAAVGVYGSTIFIAGGMTKLVVVGGPQLSVATVTSFNTDTHKWNTALPPLPVERDHVGGAVIASTFYVTGGRDHGQNNTRNNTWTLDTLNPTAWVSKASMPTARGGMAVAAIGRYIFTFGGEGNSNDPFGVFNNTEIYDSDRDTWLIGEAMSIPRHGGGGVAVGDEIYIPGGGVFFGGGVTAVMTKFEPQREHLDIF
ncbi:hypothetical protein F5884DRAFT_843024 [Xylogone sp. PMI_703]|nr:hypothetical protein F5884DRAFT_843024 [Xylogone sp. PMI_703]